LRIALVGHGKMGAALLQQWRSLKAHQFWVIAPRFAEASAAASVVPPLQASERLAFLPEPPGIADCRFDLVVMAVKPQLMDMVAPAYAARLAPGGLLASIAAGCSIARLHSLFGAAPVVRIMPNLPAAIGAGVSGLCADDRATAAQRDAITALMAAAGTTLWLDNEDQLDRFTAVAGSGPGYIFEIARAYASAAESLGFPPEQARSLTLSTMAGAIAMAQAERSSLAELRTSVTSRNGTTAAGLAALNADGGLSARLTATLDAAYRRAIALR